MPALPLDANVTVFQRKSCRHCRRRFQPMRFFNFFLKKTVHFSLGLRAPGGAFFCFFLSNGDDRCTRSSQQKGTYLAFWRRASCARAIIRRGLFFLCCCCFSCAFLCRIYFVWCQSVVVFFGCCSLLLFWLCLFGRGRAFLAVTMLLGLCFRMANTITWFSPFSAVCFLFFFVFFRQIYCVACYCCVVAVFPAVLVQSFSGGVCSFCLLVPVPF